MDPAQNIFLVNWKKTHSFPKVLVLRLLVARACFKGLQQWTHGSNTQTTCFFLSRIPLMCTLGAFLILFEGMNYLFIVEDPHATPIILLNITNITRNINIWGGKEGVRSLIPVEINTKSRFPVEINVKSRFPENKDQITWLKTAKNLQHSLV